MRARALTIVAGATTIAVSLACGASSDCPGEDTTTSIISAIPGGGFADWDSAVKAILLGNYDTNGSGSIDTPEEVACIPCGTMQALDKGVRDGWDASIRTIYGFREGMAWVGDAIGMSESIRPQADARFSTCCVSDD